MHVEKELANADFEPDAFTTDADSKADVKGRRMSFSVTTKDTNWDFVDAEAPSRKPQIFTIDLQESSRAL